MCRRRRRRRRRPAPPPRAATPRRRLGGGGGQVALTLAGLDVAMEFVASGRRRVAPADLAAAAAGEEGADEE